MTVSRLTNAIESGLVDVPQSGAIAVVRPRTDHDLSALPKDRVVIVQTSRPEYDYWQALGYAVETEIAGPFAMSVLMVPRTRNEAQNLLARLARETTGTIVVDGQKTDGIESLHKTCRKIADTSEAYSKAHGKLFVLSLGAKLPSWDKEIAEGPEGFITAPGVFSATKIDKGSEVLAAALPEKLSGRVADLGAGWGYLARALSRRPGISELHLIESEKTALDCARLNVTDQRARFHWADATTFQAAEPFQSVVTNPPFHSGRAAVPDIGRAFIAQASRLLRPSGELWLVANRQLPYEAQLSKFFVNVEEGRGTAGFKLFHATRPRRSGSR